MFKRILKRFSALYVCALIAITSGVGASATSLETEFPGVTIPVPKNYTWQNLGEVLSAEVKDDYFVIDTKAGEYTEKLFISLPNEGGFRIQSLHEFQNREKPDVSAAGLFEPSGVKKLTYKNESGALVMTGSDGTVLKYSKTNGGFELQLCKANGQKIVSLTNEQISYAYNRKGEIVRSMVEMPLAKKEAIYGGGERYNGADQVGSTISLTNVDCWCRDPYSYQNVPIFHSNRGYSVYFNMFYAGQADIGDTNTRKYSVTFDGAKLDCYFWQGMPLDNLKKFTSITGTSGVSETWTYGFWTGAQNAAFESGAGTLNNLRDLIEGYNERYNFYPEACYAEGAAARTAQVNTYLNQRNIKVLGWFSPDIWKGFGDISEHLPNNSELPVVDKNGKITDPGHPFAYDSAFLDNYGKYRISQKNYIDFSNPSSVDLIKSCWEQYWDWGVSGTMDDFGEWYSFKGTYFNGLKGDEMHNLISWYYAKSAYDAWTAAKGNDYVLFQRSGCTGSWKYTGQFLGDAESNIKGYNQSLHALISMGASGFNLYGSDLGGLGGKPSNDVWNRWVSLSAYSPYMRQHGSVIHQPWDYGMLATQNFGSVYYLRKNLVPSIESAAIKAEKTSNPIIKGMMVEYPYQLSLAGIDNQYMFCDDFLVCAVEKENVYYQKVSLPKGSTWYELNTYKAFDGGQSFEAEAPTSDFPVFVKGGSVKAINLPQSMTLKAEMHDNSGDEYSAISALLVTPPDSDRTTEIYNKIGESTDYHTYKSSIDTYTNARKSGNAFTVSNKSGAKRNIVLALGVSAADVSVDGTALTRLYSIPNYEQKQYGYYVDPDGLTTIYLPDGWKELTIVKGEKRTAYKLTGVGDSNIENMLDGKVTTAYELPQGTGKYTTVKLSGEKEIGEIDINWAVGFSNTYDIEYSTDGKNWNVILPEYDSTNTVKDGAGSYDTVKFSPVKASQLRIRTVERGDAGNSAIYSMQVFAPAESTEINPSQPDDNMWENYDDTKYDEEAPWENGDDVIESVVRRKKRVIKIVGMSKLFYILIIVCSVLGLLLIAGTVFFIVRRKRKKAAALTGNDKMNE